jgi:hypothetical protein
MRTASMAAFVVTAVMAIGPAAAQQNRMVVGTPSQKACHFYAKGPAEDALYPLCLDFEKKAADTLTRIAGAVPQWMIYACNRKVKERGDDFSLNSFTSALDCLNAALDNLPQAEMPSGSATLYIDGTLTGYRYWTAEECQRARKQGQVCVPSLKPVRKLRTKDLFVNEFYN